MQDNNSNPQQSRYRRKLARWVAQQAEKKRPPKKAATDADTPKKAVLPGKGIIARYWAERRAFDQLNLDRPACFACGYETPFEEQDGETIVSWWGRARLERCHLIAASDGGQPSPDNLVLLCRRCHQDAPMIGISPQAMIDWINRRESYTSWFVRSIWEECQRADPSLLTKCADLGLGWPEFHQAFDEAAKSLKAGLMGSGNMIATAVVCLQKMVHQREKS